MAIAKKTPAERAAAFKTIEEVRSELNKKAGRQIIFTGKEVLKRAFERVTCGSIAFDSALGGGLVLNQWIELIGPPSSGKTSFILQTIAAQQKRDKNYFVVWVASEPFSKEWAIAAGCDITRFELIETNVMEEAYDSVIEYVGNRLCDACVVDSFPALSPRNEDDNDFDQSLPGLGARITNKFFRKQGSATRRVLNEVDRDCLLMVVNQWRFKIGVLFGDPRTTPGGQMKDYTCAMRIEFARDEWIKEGTGDNAVRVGIAMRMHTVKNKTAPPERIAVCDFYFDENEKGVPAGSYDIGKDLYTAGMYFGVVEKAEKGGTHTFLDQSWTSRDKTLASIREDLDLQASLRYEILRSQGIDVDPPSKRRAAAPRKPATTPTQAVAPVGKLFAKKTA